MVAMEKTTQEVPTPKTNTSSSTMTTTRPVKSSGTSCGCSRNWVAREGADIDLWDSLRDDAMDAGCELPGMISTCDCPAADGFVCNEGVCGWNYQ